MMSAMGEASRLADFETIKKRILDRATPWASEWGHV